MELTPMQLTLICTLVQFNVPELMQPRVNCSLSAGQLAHVLRDHPTPCGPDEDAARALEALERDDRLARLAVTAYINHNDTNGFVGFAFQDGQGGVLLAFRGSESTLHCAPTNVDWIDNVKAPFDGSVQYADVEVFAKRYPSGPLWITGHSKGAHNALYALAVCDNPAAHCQCFDGQGFSRGQLTNSQRASLRARAVNYVQENDIVGALLFHPERRVFVKGTLKGNAHALSSLVFDSEGWPVPGHRTLRSIATEVLSRALASRIEEVLEEDRNLSSCDGCGIMGTTVNAAEEQ